MSVNTILTNSNHPVQPAPQKSGQNSQSNADWLASLGAAAGGGSSQFTDQMQALLNQLQGGNTVAPASATTGAASNSTTSGTNQSDTHTHHHHHPTATSAKSSDGAGLGTLQDIATNLVGDTASASGSGSDSLFGNSTDLLSGLQSLGSTAATGVCTAIQAYAAMHGIPLATGSTLV